MHVNLRRYPAIAVSRETIEKSVTDELLPMLHHAEGLDRYYALWDRAGAGVSVSVFADADAAHRSTLAARRWLSRHPEFFPQRGEEFSGGCFAHEESASPASAGAPHPFLLVRTLKGVPATQDTRAFVEQRTLPTITRWPGFRAVYMARSDRSEDEVAVVTVFDQPEAAEACHNAVLALLEEGLPQAIVLRVLQGQAVIAAE